MPTYILNYPGSESVNSYWLRMAAANKQVPSYARKGYSLNAWYTEPECINEVIPDVNSDETYYAGWVEWTAEEEEKIAAYHERMVRIKYLMARAKAFDWDSFVPFFRQAVKLTFDFESIGRPIDAEGEAALAAAEAAEKDLIQLCDPEEISWYIWGDQMPQEPEADQYDFFFRFDYPGFKPFLVPYMLEKQDRVKGNIIVIAGGGFAQRWNQSEGYCIARAFNRLGYNAFVLQRRVSPWPKEDAYLDLQRSIRYLKYHAAEYGIGAIENIATVGFSGGGGTIIGALEQCYGDVSPTVIHPEYVPDEIDAINADYGVAMPIYGGFAPGETENKNLPAIFSVIGAADDLMLGVSNRPGRYGESRFFDLLRSKPGVDMELHVFAAAGHGFGTARGVEVGLHDHEGIVGADRWIELADEFMMVRFGQMPRRYPMGQRPGVAL